MYLNKKRLCVKWRRARHWEWIMKWNPSLSLPYLRVPHLPQARFKPTGHSQRLNWAPSCCFQILALNLNTLSLLKAAPHCSELINIVNSCLSGAVGGCQERFVSTRANYTCLESCAGLVEPDTGTGAPAQRDLLSPNSAAPTAENIPKHLPREQENGLRLTELQLSTSSSWSYETNKNSAGKFSVYFCKWQKLLCVITITLPQNSQGKQPVQRSMNHLYANLC